MECCAPVTTQESKIPYTLHDKSTASWSSVIPAIVPEVVCSEELGELCIVPFANIIIVMFNVKNHVGNDLPNVYRIG